MAAARRLRGACSPRSTLSSAARRPGVEGQAFTKHLRRPDEVVSGTLLKAGLIEERDGALHPTDWLLYNLGLTDEKP